MAGPASAAAVLGPDEVPTGHLAADSSMCVCAAARGSAVRVSARCSAVKPESTAAAFQRCDVGTAVHRPSLRAWAEHPCIGFYGCPQSALRSNILAMQPDLCTPAPLCDDSILHDISVLPHAVVTEASSIRRAPYR